MTIYTGHKFASLHHGVEGAAVQEEERLRDRNKDLLKYVKRELRVRLRESRDANRRKLENQLQEKDVICGLT